jgi:hypothetical protein
MATPILDHDSLNSAMKYIWSQYRTWAMTARKHKDQVSRWRDIVLMLSIGGAVLGILGQQLQGSRELTAWPSQVLGLLSGAALGLAAYFSKELFSPDQEGNGVRARATAEALKSEAYLLATGVGPYNDVASIDELFANLDTIRTTAGNVASLTTTEAERLAGIPSAPMTIDEYLEQRVDDQISWYSSQARANTTKLSRGRTLSLILGAVAVVLGLLASKNLSVAAWIAVIGTITAAIAARQYAGRYQFLIASYQAAAEKLARLKARWEIERKMRPGTAADQKFILACEETISAENSGWMAEWTRSPKEK